MTISIITSTKNRKQTLINTLNHFYSTNTYPESKIEYIVVNDGGENLSEIAEQFKLKNFKLIDNLGVGAASGRNTGILSSKNELILLLDDDILITPEHLLNHVKAHEKYDKSLVTAHREYPKNMLQLMRKTPFGRYKEKYDYLWEAGWVSKNIGGQYYEMESLASFSCSFKRIYINRKTMFNDSFPFAGCEDQEFSKRMKLNGYTLIYDSKNLCYHNETFNVLIENWLNRQYTGIQGYIILCELYPELKENRLYIENYPVCKTDSLKIKIKKYGKKFIGKPTTCKLLLKTSKVFETFKIPDRMIFFIYNLLFVSYIHKGFSEALEKNKINMN